MSQNASHPLDANHPAVKLLEELLNFPSPPGREERMASFLRQKIEALGFTPESDAAGNLWVNLPSQKKIEAGSLMLAAHMDEIALVVSRIEPDGRLRVVRSGGLFPHKMGERAVEILGDGDSLQGVLSSGAGHGSGNNGAAVTWDDYWIVTGWTREQLRERGIHPGAGVVPIREGRGPIVFGDPADPLVGAWTFDDRMGVVTLLRLLQKVSEGGLVFQRPVTIAFTVHEEGGAHGAKGLAHRLQPETLLAVDGCPLTAESEVSLRGGPVVWAKDFKAQYSVPLVRELAAVAKSAGLPLQRAVLLMAYSDASASYDVGGIPQFGVVGHPRENSHGFEVAPIRVFDQVLDLLSAYLEKSAP